MDNTEKLQGTVLSVKGDKSLVLVDGTKYYILLARIDDYVGESVSFAKEDSLPMPSFLFAIAAMAEDDLSGTLDEIKENWFLKTKNKR